MAMYITLFTIANTRFGSDHKQNISDTSDVTTKIVGIAKPIAIVQMTVIVILNLMAVASILDL